MKKYFNKGLMYQWFNSSKLAIILGSIIFAFCSFSITEGRFRCVRNSLRNSFNSHYDIDIERFAVLAFIFIVIFLAGQSLNKRNKEMFLSSSPFTKKQIRYNEVLCLLITVNLFVLIYLYMAVMSFYRHYDLFTITSGYFETIFYDVLRIYLIGTMGILLLASLNSMFSNSIAGIIATIALVPASILSVITNIKFLFDNVIIDKKCLGAIIFSENTTTLKDNRNFLFSYYIPSEYITSKTIINDIILGALIILILSLVYIFSQKINKSEYSTKLFTSKISEKAIIILFSIGISCFIALTIVNYSDFYYIHNSLTWVYAYIPALIVLSFGSYFMLKRLVRKVQ